MTQHVLLTRVDGKERVFESLDSFLKAYPDIVPHSITLYFENKKAPNDFLQITAQIKPVE